MPRASSPVLRLAARMLRSGWRDLLATDSLFRLLVLALLVPLLGGVLKGFVAWSGGPLLADTDLLRFALSPAGLSALLVAAIVRVAILFLQQASLLAIADGALRGERVRVVAALRFAAGRGVGVLRLAARMVLRLLLIALPFLGVAGFAAWRLLDEFDINYYLQERPSEFWLAAGIGGGLLLVMAALLIERLARWSLAVPLLLFEEVPVARALRESEERTRGRRRRIVAAFVGWAAASLVASALVLLVVRLLGGALMPLVGGSLNATVPLLGALLALASFGGFLAGVASSASLAVLVVAMHQALGGKGRAAAAERSSAAPLRSLTRHRLLAAVLILAGASSIAAWLLLRDLRAVDDAVILAHRGASYGAPENTLAALRLAIDERADWAEIDVQETSDGAVVVHHDADFMRVAGSPLKVWEATLAQVQELDVGVRVDARFRGERVPTLAEVLETAKGRIRVLIEFKHYGHAVRLEERVADLVEFAGMTEQVAVMSLDWTSVARLRALRPQWRAGLLAAKTFGRVDGIDADFLAVSRKNAKPAFLRSAVSARKQVYVWTLNDALALSLALSDGVDGVITDHPGLARAVLEQRAGMSSAERLLVEAAFALGIAPEIETEQ